MEVKVDTIIDRDAATEIRDVLREAYMRDIREFTYNRYACRKWGYRFEAIGKVLTGVAAVLSFVTAGVVDVAYGGVISGSVGVCAVTFQNLSGFLLHRSRENTEQLDSTLESIRIHDSLPDVIPATTGAAAINVAHTDDNALLPHHDQEPSDARV